MLAIGGFGGELKGQGAESLGPCSIILKLVVPGDLRIVPMIDNTDLDDNIGHLDLMRIKSTNE